MELGEVGDFDIIMAGIYSLSLRIVLQFIGCTSSLVAYLSSHKSKYCTSTYILCTSSRQLEK